MTSAEPNRNAGAWGQGYSIELHAYQAPDKIQYKMIYYTGSAFDLSGNNIICMHTGGECPY